MRENPKEQSCRGGIVLTEHRRDRESVMQGVSVKQNDDVPIYGFSKREGAEVMMVRARSRKPEI